jgi:hypothetical protein
MTQVNEVGSLSLRLVLKSLEPQLPNFNLLPYDCYCPSVQDKLAKQICKTCHLYFTSQVAMKNHSVLHRQIATPNEDSEEIEEIECTVEEVPIILENDEITDMIVIGDRLGEWYAPQFEMEEVLEHMPIF